uniref:AnkA n=2 Tax=Anaplasma phagocytophilum TaxID=948 RepID=Q7X5P9_ANAPH|nr:AnkA [Anaplasma phagocytophilum]QAT79161.1 AnkA [Anaplasma phagocytophilum]
MLTEEEKKKSACALQAIITGDYDSFQASIQGISSEGLNTPVDKEGRTLLHYAASSRNGNFYGILVERGCVTNPKDAYGFTPGQAREKAGYARTQWYGADVNDPGVSRQLMTQAVQQSAKGNMYGALAILDLVRNDDANIQVNEKGHGVLHLACIEGSDPSFTSSLMLKGCSLNIKDVDGNTPLHTAVTSVGKNALGNLDVLCDKALIADVNAKGPGGNTPLHIATERMDHQKVERLLSRLSDISIANDAGETVCHIVAKQWPRRDVLPYIDKMQEAVSSNIEGNRECAEALIFPDKKGMSAVQYAIRRHIPEAEKIFEKAINIADKVYGSASPEVKSLFTCPNPEDASTLVHFVSSNGTPNFDPLAKRVLEEAYHRYGGEPFTNLDIAGNAPIHAAAQRSTVAVFEQLARYTPESVVNQLAPNGKAPIHMIVEDEPSHKGVSVKLQMLIENVRNIPSINVPSPVTGETPVVAAYKGGNTEDVKTMLRCGSMDVDAQSHDGKTIIHCAAKDGNLEILQQALGRKSSYSKFPVRDGVPTPGVYAVREAKDPKGLEKVLDALMDREPNPQHVAVEAIKRGSRELLDHLITKKVVDVNERFVNSEGQETTLAFEALGAGQYDIVKYLIKNGAAVEGVANESALAAGILGGCFQGRRAVLHMERVIGAGASVNAPMGTLSPLAAAVRAVNEGADPKAIKGIIDSLVQKGANLGSMDEQGNPALHLALVNARGKIAKVLIKAGANPEQLDFHGRTPLHVAAAVGDTAQFKMIARSSPEQCFSSHSYTGDTPLHEALASREVTEKSFLKMLKEIKGQVSPECFLDVINARQLASGESLLHMAAARGYGKTCKILVNAGAEVSIVDIEGKTPADVAAPSLKARPWFFGKSVAKQLEERVQVPEGGFPPYVPEEHIPAGYRTPTWESISSLSSVSDLSSTKSIGELSSDSEVEGPSAPSTPGVESIYTTAGAEAPEEPIYEDIKDVRGAGDVESVYATAGAAVTSETQEGVKGDSVRLRGEKHESIYSEVKGSIVGERPESIYADPFDVVKPKQARPESIYADPFAGERAASSETTTSAGPKEEPIYATVKKGPKKSDATKKEATSPETAPEKGKISVVKKKEKPQVPVRTSSLSPKGDLGSDKGQGPETSSSFASELQAQKGKLRPVKEGAPESKASSSLFSSEEFKKALLEAAEGLQGAVAEAQKGDAGAEKAKQDPGMESGAPGSQPEAPQSEGHKPVKGGGRGR